jgi:hypothetical protein
MSDTIFEVFRAVKIHVNAFWVVTLCSVAVGYQYFGGPCCLHFHYVASNSEDFSLNVRCNLCVVDRMIFLS